MSLPQTLRRTCGFGFCLASLARHGLIARSMSTVDEVKCP